MSLEGCEWREAAGRWQLVSGARVIAQVVPDARGAEVIIDCRMVWQVVRGRAGSVQQGMRHAERWIAASDSGSVRGTRGKHAQASTDPSEGIAGWQG
jgi:hypothetical protein